jgi:hypothetical protein
MQLNSIIFPAPMSSYTAETFESDMVYIPKHPDQSKSNSDVIPCLYLPYTQGSNKLMIYYHGNAEDVGSAQDLLNHISNTLKIHILAIEFQGYGMYPGTPNSKNILEDSITVFDYLTEELNFDAKDVFLFGRSMGSGPATEVAALKDPGALLLMSAYTSIRNVVKNIAGSLSSYMVAERFRNIDVIP